MATVSTTTWRAVEIRFESDRDYRNPYLDVEVEVAFRGPTGRVIRRPAFWDGGRTWAVRFAPDAPGTWRYEATSNDSVGGFAAVRGDLECVPPSSDHDIYTHGFLEVRRGERYLRFADGTPFFWLGDTHWRFAWERWDESNKPGWSSQFRGTVDRRVRQGFTVYQSNVMSWEPSREWVADRTGEAIDVTYFQSTLDPRMAYVADHGLVHAVGFAWYSAVDEGPDRLARFARYFVARYGAYPIVWTLGGEVAGYEPDRRQERIDGWREVAAVIREADGYDHPRTAHLTNERPIAQYYQGEDWLSLTLNQLGHGDFDMSASHYAAHFAKYPDTPVVEGESMYEGLISVEPVGRRSVSDTIVRQVAYRAMQSGCCGYTYGAQGCWNAAWDQEHGRTMWGDLPWYSGVDLPGADQVGHMRRFYESIDWTSLRPDPTVFHTSDWVNATAYPPNVSADPARRTIVAYFGETYRNGQGAAYLAGLPDADFRLRWFDPRRGEFLAVDDPVPVTHGRIAVPDKPDGEDWVLLAGSADAPHTTRRST
jgi:hypothetical protein